MIPNCSCDLCLAGRDISRSGYRIIFYLFLTLCFLLVAQQRDGCAHEVAPSPSAGDSVEKKSDSDGPVLLLTPEEKDFVRQHPVIRISNQISRPPYDFYEDGEAQGFSIDYLRLLAKIIGVQVQVISGDWDRLVERLQKREIDLLHTCHITTDLHRFSYFTTGYYSIRYMIVTQFTNNTIRSMDDLEGKTLAMPASLPLTAFIRESYPGIRILEMRSTGEAMEAVAYGRADALIEDFFTVNYLFDKLLLTNLKIAARAEVSGWESSDLYIAVRDDWSLFHSLLQKAMDAVPDEEMQQLSRKWLSRFMGVDHQATVKLALTDEELIFLKEHPTIRVLTRKNFPPFSFVRDSEVSGYVNDYLRLLASKLGLVLDFVLREESVESESVASLLSEQNIDMIGVMEPVEGNSPGLLLTERGTVTAVSSLLSRGSRDRFSSLESLQGKVLAVVRGSPFVARLQADFPDIDLLLTDNTIMSMQNVLSGQADAAFDNYAIFNYYLEEYFFQDLVITPLVGDSAFPETALRIGIREDLPLLKSIFDKAMAQLSSEEILRLQDRWFRATASRGGQAGKQVTLTTIESSWLKNKGSISMCIDPDRMPLERMEEGRHIGIAADYVELFEKELGIPIQLVPTISWNQSIEFARQRKCDILTLALETPERREFLDFTIPYLNLPLVLATRTEELFVPDITAIHDRKFGVVRGYAFGKSLRDRYPEMHIVEVASVADGLNQVQQGQLYGFIDTLPTIGYAIQNQYVGTLKIAGKFDETLELKLGVRNDEPLLLSVLNKAVATIAPERQQQILNRWISVKYEKGVDYTLLWKILSGIGVVGLFLLYRYWALNQYNRKLEVLSVTDRLTQVYNRLKLDEILNTQLAFFKRSNQVFSVILIDIDYFKKVNDSYGHLAGDNVLVEFARILARTIRKTDFLGRWGGEEFLIICPDTDIHGALTLAEVLRREICEHEFPEIGHMTASFGVAQYNDQELTGKDLIQQVDQALYAAKEGGRNQVRQYHHNRLVRVV
ncbi:transporter substrate-binding domain-containing diguanylate cyclase [Desulfolithobacter sp.]